MTKLLREAFAEHGMRAAFRGQPAMILPVSEALAAEMADGEFAKTGQDVTPGQMLVSWTEDGQRRGQVLNTFAGNDISFAIARTDGGEDRIHGADMRSAALRFISMARDDVREREAIVAKNAEARAAYEVALGRGEHPDEPVALEPTYVDGAFSKGGNLVATVKTAIQSMIDDPFADVVAKTKAYAAQHELGRANSNVLTAEEMRKVSEKVSLRQEIGRVSPDHAMALAAPGQPYAGENAGEAARDVVEDLNVRGRGFTAQQMAALASNPVLVKEVFSVLTTTPPGSIVAQQLDAEGYQAVAQDLARQANRDWAPQALERIGAVLGDRMPGYRFEAKLFTKDDADIMIIRDHVGAYLYSWDSASRVAEVNVQNTVLSTFTKDDVPTDEELHALRVTLQDLRYDNGAEIDFNWGDEPEDGEVLDDDLDDEDDYGIGGGPRPAGH